MQLIVGCRARGASWAGSETLVIPGNRLTIHVYVRIHGRANTRVHIYWFRVGVCMHAAYTGWIRDIANGWSRTRSCGRLLGWKFAASHLDEWAQSRFLSRFLETFERHREQGRPRHGSPSMLQRTPCILKYILTNTKRLDGRARTGTTQLALAQIRRDCSAELPVFVPLICFADYRRPYN